MSFKDFFKKILYPHIVILTIFVIVSTVLLVFGFISGNLVVSYISYFISAYTLLVFCLRIPDIIKFFKTIKNKNKLIKRWFEDIHFRIKFTLYGSLAFNILYSILQLGLGITHHSFWFCSLSGYYFILAVMRFSLSRHISANKELVDIKSALIKYRNCGITLLVLNIMISLMIFFMVYWNRTFIHNEITTIALAAYTFTALTFAIINAIKFRKLENPVYSAIKRISLASACVSILTLEATMLTTFGNGSASNEMRRIMLGVSGAVISVFIIAMAIQMIVESTKKIKHN